VREQVALNNAYQAGKTDGINYAAQIGVTQPPAPVNVIERIIERPVIPREGRDGRFRQEREEYDDDRLTRRQAIAEDHINRSTRPLANQIRYVSNARRTPDYYDYDDLDDRRRSLPRVPNPPPRRAPYGTPVAAALRRYPPFRSPSPTSSGW
jgi:hypothetical protein